MIKSDQKCLNSCVLGLPFAASFQSLQEIAKIQFPKSALAGAVAKLRITFSGASLTSLGRSSSTALALYFGNNYSAGSGFSLGLSSLTVAALNFGFSSFYFPFARLIALANSFASRPQNSLLSCQYNLLNSRRAAIRKQSVSSILRPISAATRPEMSATSIHVTALDGIVNVNSLFTFAVFIGLAWNPTDTNNNLIDPTQPPDCSPSPATAERLVCFNVYSFSCFLFSSLVALGLKQAIRLARDSPAHWPIDLALVNKTGLRVGYAVSAAGSVCGSVFLMLALVDVVQIKLGMLGCGGSRHGFAAVVPLVILVPSGLLIYVCTVLYAFTR